MNLLQKDSTRFHYRVQIQRQFGILFTNIRLQVTDHVLGTAMKHVTATNSIFEGTTPIIITTDFTARLALQTLIFRIGTNVGTFDKSRLKIIKQMHRNLVDNTIHMILTFSGFAK